MHGEAKTQHGLRRAVRRGLANVAIQAYLTAAVINLKRLAAHTGLLFAQIHLHLRICLVAERFDFEIAPFYGNRKRKSATNKGPYLNETVKVNCGVFQPPARCIFCPGKWCEESHPTFLDLALVGG